MIRFIDLRGQIDTFEDDKAKQTTTFAFFDTVIDKFIQIDFDQKWNTVQEFKQSCSNAQLEMNLFHRMLALIPPWVKDA